MQNVITLGEQIKQFSTVRDTLATIMGPTETEEFLAKSLFFISIGSNDIFLYHYSNSTVPKQEFIATLGSAYENHLKVAFLFKFCLLEDLFIYVGSPRFS